MFRLVRLTFGFPVVMMVSLMAQPMPLTDWWWWWWWPGEWSWENETH